MREIRCSSIRYLVGMTRRTVRCDTCEDPLRSEGGPTVIELPEASAAEQRSAADLFMDEHRHHHVDPDGVTFSVDPPFES